jgi:hypothetical protein
MAAEVTAGDCVVAQAPANSSAIAAKSCRPRPVRGVLILCVLLKEASL